VVGGSGEYAGGRVMCGGREWRACEWNSDLMGGSVESVRGRVKWSAGECGEPDCQSDGLGGTDVEGPVHDAWVSCYSST
jgi:hypothetical protein